MLGVENAWLTSALWIGLALLSSLISIRVMGSTCQSLVRLSPCTVLVVK